MEKKTFEVINLANAKFMYQAEEKKLVSIKLVSITYYIEAGCADCRFSIGGDDSNVSILDLNGKYYVSEAAFKSGAFLPKENAVQTQTLNDVMNRVFRAYMVKEDEVGPFVWVYENGQAVKWRLEEHTKKVTIQYDCNQVLLDCALPEAYRSAEDVYKYNDYILQEKPGECIVREGVYKRLFLTDEQNALVDKLQAVIDECNKAGVAIDFDYADNTVTCFNRNGIKDYGWDPDFDSETEESYKLELDRAGRSLRGISDINTDENSFIIEKPKQ